MAESGSVGGGFVWERENVVVVVAAAAAFRGSPLIYT